MPPEIAKRTNSGLHDPRDRKAMQDFLSVGVSAYERAAEKALRNSQQLKYDAPLGHIRVVSRPVCPPPGVQKIRCKGTGFVRAERASALDRYTEKQQR